MTVFGGTKVLSAIFAQSLIIVNFPCHRKLHEVVFRRRDTEKTYDDTVPPYLDVVSDLSSLNDAVRTYVYVIAYLHWVIVEVSAVRFIRRSASPP